VARGGFGVHIEGLKETVDALDEIDAELGERLRRELRDIAQTGSDMAAYIAASKGDIYKGVGDHGDPGRRDGDLVHKIKVKDMPGIAYKVVEYSRTRTKRYPSGYRYPNRLEYGMSGRAFMAPMRDAMEPIAVDRLRLMADKLIEEKGF
jgi:hypothetical protein